MSKKAPVRSLTPNSHGAGALSAAEHARLRMSAAPKRGSGEPAGTTLAAIDVGSNAIRLEIATVRRTGDLVERESIREPVRLGHRVFLTGLLEEKEMEKAVAALSAFRAVMDRHGVNIYRAVATSAVREAQNRDLFLERVSNAAGVDLEAISGAEESRLLALGVQRRAEVSKRRALFVDIGGGSVEFAVAHQGKILFSQSQRLGAVRLSELFLEGKRAADEKRALLEEYLERMLQDTVRELRKLRPEILLAVGGNAETIARIVNSEADARTPLSVPARELAQLTDKLCEMEPEERARKFDLRPDRVDTIVPASVLLSFLVRRLELPRLEAPMAGIRDGMLAELADRVVGRYDPQAAARGVLEEAERLGEHYHYDAKHAAQVRELALTLFDALRGEHRLSDRDRMLLGVAATLHDIGEFVGYAHHHKHSHYLILNSELGGLSSEELRLVAVATRYHRRAHPSDRHEEYAGLSRDERRRVSRIAAILRVADSLDREHRQKVRRLRLGARRGVVEIRPEAAGDLALERWALPAKASLFREVFGLEVKLLEVGATKASPAAACADRGRRTR